MFNKELKEKFLEENYSNPATKAKARGLFKSTIDNFENKYGKDLSEFTPEEINGLLKDKSSGSFKTLETLFPFCRQYARFIGEETGVRNDYLITLSYDDLRNIVPEKMEEDGSRAISREVVLGVCTTLENPRDKVLVLGLFEGISGKQMSEFLEIRPEDVFDHHVYIRSRDLDLPISDALSQYFKDAMKAERYEFVQVGRYGETDLIKGDEVAIKILDSKVDPLRGLRAVMARVSSTNRDLGEFTIPTLRYSGMANKIIETMDDRRISVERAYDIKRPRLLKEYGLERINKPKLFRMLDHLLEEREKLNE